MSAAAVPPVPTADRTHHPFHTYEMINEIPATSRETLRRLAVPAAEAAALLADRPSLVLTGCGTASYAARVAEGFARSPSGRLDSREVDAFELAGYGPRVGGASGVVGISHSGITKTTVDALRDARGRGARTVGITHFADRPIGDVSDRVLIAGNGPDLSRCHTKCYIGGALAAGMVALEWRVAAGDEPRASIQAVWDHLSSLPPLQERVLATTDRAAEELAAATLSCRSLGFFGAGPNWPTALEAALKVRESSFLPALGMELEDFLHGSWQPLDRDSLAFVVATEGFARPRALDLLKAARALGTHTVAVANPGDEEVERLADTVFTVPLVDELISPLLNIIPLYLYAYYASVKRGNNPDFLRYLDPAYWQARQFIFPPGTH